MGVDIFGGVRLQNNWSIIRVEQCLNEIVKSGSKVIIVCGSNSDEIIMSRQCKGAYVR